jgi:hypothetical protein
MINTIVCNAAEVEFSDNLILYMLKKGYNLKETYITNDLRILVFSK